ncbi:hypothetical protein OSB04_002016 [Centaurea solstitialis]|uniref:F-box domain-containing protein n=1 Tax=Centaurea solstitialis TaxID=347529 RepID=A0AA38U3U0_9ASTR|nr:hypothetical protein OSB04_002016 [Centaurea solstitialis]
MEERRDWLQMPDEIMGGMILQRLDHVDILTSVQKVCRNWRRICKDPAMWKIIDMDYSSCRVWYTKKDFENLIKQAVHRSCGELIHIRLNCPVTKDLLDFISRRSSKLKSLRLMKCYSRITGKVLNDVRHGVAARSSLKSYELRRGHGLFRTMITGNIGLLHAVKRLPCLETLDVFYFSIYPEDIYFIGRCCPRPKYFNIRTRFMESDGDALALASMLSTLRSRAILLHGCGHLESPDLPKCCCFKLGGNLEKLCRERRRSNQYEFSGSDDFCDDYWL